MNNPMPEATKPIAIYMRVSTRAQKYESQEGPLLAFCEARKWTSDKFEIFREKAPGKLKSRPILDQILRGARSGKVKTIVVYKLDRLGRSLSHLSWVNGELGRMGVALISLTEGIDTSESNPMRTLQINILGAFGELERDMIRERVVSGLTAARKRGVHIGRPNTSLALAEQAIALRKKGHTVDEIAKRLKTSPATASRLTSDCGAPKRVRGRDRKPRLRKRALSKLSPQNLALFPGGR